MAGIGKGEVKVTVSNNGGCIINVTRPQRPDVLEVEGQLRRLTNMSPSSEVYTTMNVDDAVIIIRDKLLELQA